MPSIRIIEQYGTPKQKEVWITITEHNVDPKTGYLTLFSMAFTDGSVGHYHIYRKDISLLRVATHIFDNAMTLRSAKGLMQDFNKFAGKEAWHGKAGVAGIVLASATILHDFLQSRPFEAEGYYDSSGNLFLPRTIDSRNRNDYNPD